MAPDSKAGRTLATVPPGVDGRDGYVEISGEFLHAEEPDKVVHSRILDEDPVTAVSGTLSAESK